MKPSILYIIYAILVLLIIHYISSIFLVFAMNKVELSTALYNSGLSLIALILAIPALIYLLKKRYVGRVLSTCVFGYQAFLTLASGIYLYFNAPADGAVLLGINASYTLPLLFLTYKTQSSKPLQEYLKSA